MTHYSRRQFVKKLAAVTAFCLAQKFVLPLSVAAKTATDFDILVVGDSFIWGQGLKESDKFYTLVKNWLETDVFGRGRRVGIKVKAHSGSKIGLDEKQIAEMNQSGEDPEKFHYPEADLSFPSITFQVEAARAEYKDPDSVKLVMLSGGITDLVVANAVNPFLRERKMRNLIHRHLHAAMTNLLIKIADSFPEALIVVVGYFPIVSTKSDVNTLTKYLMKIVRFPHPLQFLLTNPFSKQFMKIVRKATADRSRIWVAESNKELRDAVREVNEKCKNTRVLFVESPITEETCFATKNPMLWGMDRDNRPEDDLYKERRTGCREVFSQVNFKPYGLVSTRICELASVAHPNKAGSIAYFEAIKKTLATECKMQNANCKMNVN